jgi:RNA polymerase sigma-70 factor (ECF subfamily)
MSSISASAPPDEPADAILVAAAQANPGAFAALYDRYLGRIYRYCYLRLAGPEEAEEATSRVFLQALAGLSAFRGGLFVAWLFRIAQNVVVDVERARRPAAPLQARNDPPDPALGPEEATLARAEVEALRAALAVLPREQQAVLELGLAGWRGEEIATALGKSVPAVKMMRLRALRRLRRLLAEGGGPRVEVRDERA